MKKVIDIKRFSAHIVSIADLLVDKRRLESLTGIISF